MPTARDESGDRLYQAKAEILTFSRGSVTHAATASQQPSRDLCDVLDVDDSDYITGQVVMTTVGWCWSDQQQRRL